ncbi:3'-5' exonuclease [Vreelandella jeotgali]|uniref:3'-5' exonuclease n=1 Tax=Vreelandella jeotgali TaxID=553386 RepID=UPI0003461973|nr:3'-5' exonuclease [Halomonas jeotgali]
MTQPQTVFLDTETTGLHAGHDEILEIALVDDAGHTLLDTLICPDHRTEWPGAQRIHGIAPDDVRGALRLGDVLPEVVAAVSEARLVIYNAAFDMGFLPEAVSRSAAQVACCMEAYAEYHGDYSEYHGSYTWQPLRRAAAHVAHDWGEDDAHRAHADALACRAVWRYLEGSDAYRAAVDAQRAVQQQAQEDAARAATLLTRYEQRRRNAARQRHNTAQTHASRVIERYFLRQTADPHWITAHARHDAAQRFAAIFANMPYNTPAECLDTGIGIESVYRRKSDIPEHLAPARWFPSYRWLRRLLVPVAVYAGPRAAHALYAKDQLDDIRAAYPLRFAPMPDSPATRTDLRHDGVPEAQIDALEPAADCWNAIGKHWYPVYDRNALKSP